MPGYPSKVVVNSCDNLFAALGLSMAALNLYFLISKRQFSPTRDVAGAMSEGRYLRAYYFENLRELSNIDIGSLNRFSGSSWSFP